MSQICSPTDHGGWANVQPALCLACVFFPLCSGVTKLTSAGGGGVVSVLKLPAASADSLAVLALGLALIWGGASHEAAPSLTTGHGDPHKAV